MHDTGVHLGRQTWTVYTKRGEYDMTHLSLVYVCHRNTDGTALLAVRASNAVSALK